MAELKIQDLADIVIVGALQTLYDAISGSPAQVKIKGTPGEVRAALTGYIEGQRKVLESIENIQKSLKGE